MALPNLPYTIDAAAVQNLQSFCAERQLRHFVLVCDQNTYPALGSKVEAALRSQGLDVITANLGENVIADERSIVRTLLAADAQERVYLAVGSGTLTDIARFCSFKARTSFISLPTAASVDGYFSTGAPLVIGGLKQTYYTHAPLAVFADLPTLCAAPSLLTGAGFGDMVAKYLSLADWKLGHLLWDERYDPEIAERVAQAAAGCAAAAEAIGRREPEAIRALMEGLIDSGLCMLAFGNSYPASGAEHHISHFWEMLLLNQGRPPIYHGLKVAAASVLTAGWYADLRQVGRVVAAQRIACTTWPGSDSVRRKRSEEIQAAFGPAAGEVLAQQQPFMAVNPFQLMMLKQRIMERWDEVEAIAASVPAPEVLAGWLQAAGCPSDAASLGFSPEEAAQGLALGQYVRPRFTIAKLRQILG